MTTSLQIGLIPPHGGALINRQAAGAEAQELRQRAAGLPRIALNARQLSDAQMIAQGVFSPLQGFMGQADYRRVVEEMRLADGRLWPLPVTLDASAEAAAGLQKGMEFALADPAGQLVGVMRLQEVYAYDKRAEARLVYRTEDEAHPGVANVYRQGDRLLGGPITLFAPPQPDPDVAPFYRTPEQTRQEFSRLGWRTVVGFQTRNPVHRAHEYIQKTALEIVDGLLLHPLVGETKSDDIPAAVRMRCYRVLLDNYYPKQRTLLSVFPAFMRYAGPREAVFHAVVRKNYGCTHFIVGRDHAGVGNYYGTYDAQLIFRDIPLADLGITPLFFENSFFCKRCQGMASDKTCPHDATARVNLSGTQVRSLLQKGAELPPEFTRPEVAQVLLGTA